MSLIPLLLLLGEIPQISPREGLWCHGWHQVISPADWRYQDPRTFYNGWKHDHYVTNVFMFTPDGIIRSMVINLPGDTHDLAAANYGFIYKKLEDFFNKCGNKCVIDSALSLIRG
eukprot:6600246-Ditylum_brightwellii.AAC.2